jgi:hypothetical protein
MRLATEAGCTHVDVSAPGISLRLAGVSMVPGRMTLAVMLASLFSSRLSPRVLRLGLKINKSFLPVAVTFGLSVDTYYDSVIPRPKAQMCGASLEIV